MRSSEKETRLIDAVSYLHMLINDAYPLQFSRAYPTEDLRERARGVWAGALRKFPPKRIKKAAEKAIRGGNKFMPSLGDIINLCQPDLKELGLKQPLQAYYEACTMKNPTRDSPWSHMAVYYAGKATGWFFLENESQERVMPLFEHNYQILCNRVKDGEPLDQEIRKGLNDMTGNNKSTSVEERLQQTQKAIMANQGIDPASGRQAFEQLMKEWV